MAIVSFSQGLYQDYLDLPVKNPNQLYFCTDTQQLFLGSDEYTSQVRQFTTMPQTWEVGKIVEYTGDTDEDYTQGYFYQMTEDGWSRIDVQPDIRPQVVTYAQYQLLTPEEIASGAYIITDYPETQIDSSEVLYDNTTVYNELNSINNNLEWRTF